jgi:tRNA-uridine 2-sulfurtransferase
VTETFQNNKKILLGLSGGVDSAVSAVLLKEAGYQVDTVYIECWNEPGCRAEEDRKDALAIALQLDLPFQVLDFKTAYKEKVMGYFLSEYKSGKTPNPDVMCNKIIKFGLFYDWALENGYDSIATGHYAATDGEHLLIPKDIHKDQTYFLYEVNKEQIPKIIFPLQDLMKQEVRQLAIEKNIPVANKKDSVGICFVGDINVPNFLRENLGENPGNIIDKKGNILGRHKGLWFHTIGQRHGFSYDKKLYSKLNPDIDKGDIPALYVIEKKQKTNELVIGLQENTLQNSFIIEDIHLINFIKQEILQAKNLSVRIRNTGKRVPCSISTNNKKDGLITVNLSKKINGVASGQSAVFYLEKNNQVFCVGGGIIL